MSKSREAFRLLGEKRLIGLLSPPSAEDCLRAYEELSPLGIVLEVAFRTDAAAEGIRAVLEKHPDALLLAGTVLTRRQAREALAAGAAGVVSPDFFPEVVEECAAADAMAVPGGLSDCGKQLALKAALYGCDLLELGEKHPHQWIYKLFPAAAGGQVFSGLARAWRGPYPGLRIIHTGGVGLENLDALNRSDGEGVFCGSALTAGRGKPGAMAAEARRWIEVLRPSLGATAV
ncbi:MAG: bifunctional 4-hydroxy-2-oxoglutarate aldolase/2-dehydro-3-deoxy-phosphogluconate aldolase [Candidatus Aminicenantes bacterium]|nr:bifunctional 4-hydroxy-2-oxoglutarate aldolase/2-dehydro-3-deoxy-phosphogluconate aldolase [Candidatus Aminicenantes bacterium]